MNWFRSDGAFFKRLCRGILIVLICIPLWLTVVRYSAWKIAAFLFFWILCPGMFANRFIWKQDDDDFLMSVFSGFFMGMALLFIEWFVLYLIGLRRLIIFINPCCTVVSFIWYFVKRDRKPLPKAEQRYSIELPFLIILLAAVYLCAYSLNFSMPRAVDISSADCTWQIGNINQLASDSPFRDIRVDGVKVRYHFFSTMFLAIAKYIFGGQGWIYFAQYQIWFLPFVIAVSFWKLYGRAVQNKFFAAVMSISTMAGFTLGSGVWNYHIFSNVNSTGLGVSCLILLFLNLEKAEVFFTEKRKWEKKYLLWSAQQILFLFLMTGIKGPFAMLYVLAVCAWTVIRCVKGKAKGVCLPAFAIINVLVFAVMYRFLFIAGTQGYFSDWGVDSILQSVLDERGISGLYEKSGLHGVHGRAVFLLPALLETFTVLLPFGVLAFVDLFRFLLGKRDLSSDRVLAHIVAGGGLCAYYLFHTPDNVQMYFLFAVTPFAGYLCADKAYALIKKDVWRYVFCAGMLLFAFFEMNSGGKQIVSLFPERLMRSLTESYPEAEPMRACRFEAYEFLKDHTDKKAMMATNYQGAGTFHEISAFGERRCYLEGYEYSVENFGFDKAEERLGEMERLFGNDWNDVDRYGFCESLGINYLVFFKDEAAQPLKSSESFRNVFDNDAVAIYEVGRQP